MKLLIQLLILTNLIICDYVDVMKIIDKYNIKIKHEITKQYNKYLYISYNKKLELPNYSLNYISSDITNCKKCRHKGKQLCNFMNDQELNNLYSVETRCPEYLKNIKYFGRGHLAPSADFCILYGKDSYYTTNTVPQHSKYNKILWNQVEKYVREKYINHWVMTAPEFNNSDKINDACCKKNEILIPSGFYKIVFNEKGDIVWNIYVKHNFDTFDKYIKCNKKIECASNNMTLPYFFDTTDKYTSYILTFLICLLIFMTMVICILPLCVLMVKLCRRNNENYERLNIFNL